MDFIRSHKKSFIVAIACLVLIILAGFAVYRMLYPNSDKSEYGNRLEGAPNIDNAVMEKIKVDISNKGITNSVNYSSSGPIIQFIIDVKTGTTKEKAQELTNVIKDSLSTTITSFYDIEVYITQKDNTAAVDYPMIGYKSKSSDKFTFVINKSSEVK